MPPKRNDIGAPRRRKGAGSPPPKVMTWPLATPALAIAVVFDLGRLFFVMFWFFGPFLLGVYCKSMVGGAWVVSKVLVGGCAAGATYVGVVGYGVTAVFGTVMAMAVGFAGWLAVGGLLLATNARIFKENTMWFVGSLLFSEVPIIGAIPSITISVWKMYSNQIRIEKAAYKKWEQKQNASLQQEKQQQMSEETARAQSAAADDAQYTQEMDRAA